MAILVDRPIEVGPRPRATTGCFINAPRGANGTSMRTRRLLVSGQETLDPALHGAPIDDKAALRKPRHTVGIAEPGAHGVADGSGEHVGGEGMVREGSGGASREAVLSARSYTACMARPTPRT